MMGDAASRDERPTVDPAEGPLVSRDKSEARVEVSIDAPASDDEAERASESVVSRARSATPARILRGRAGPAYRTATALELRRDHAFAVDAVHVDFDLARDFPSDLVSTYKLFEVDTLAPDKRTYLMRPDLGRSFSAPSRQRIVEQCAKGADLQIVIGDGLSAVAVSIQVPLLLPLLVRTAESQGMKAGQPFVIRRCRVGIVNEVGAVLDPKVVVLLIGERPGLATAESLSAYMAYRPRPDHTDAQRNLISNIHRNGVSVNDAAVRIVKLADKMRRLGLSGVAVKEDGFSSLPPPNSFDV